MEDVFLPIVIVGMLFIGLPWIIFHYVTKWKSASSLTTEDENLLDELHDLARRLDDRMCTIERIMTAENPNWRAAACDPAEPAIEAALRTENLSDLQPGLRSNQPSRRM
jgi:phage shock protein B